MLKRYQSRVLFAGILSLLVFYGARPAFAQEAQQTQKKQSSEQSVQHVKIYRVKHQNVSSLMPTISRIAENADASKTVRIAFDLNTNSLIVSADEKTQKLVESLLQELDVEPPKIEPNEPATRDVMIRVVWLVDERLIEGDSNGTAIPPDLLPTVEKLRKKFGLEPLATAGQIIINQRNIGQTEFEGSGSALIQGESKLNVMGRVILGNDQIAELQLIVQIASERNDVQGKIQQQIQGRGENDSMCQLSSKISVSMGRPVFFGMSPIESKTSLFIVQVLDANSVADETARSEK